MTKRNRVLFSISTDI